ncbi:MAG TPA: hypothetical protein VMS31_19420, partial [Pyrinomonadaceae bacterium]|nr:hypothetical protein [Pyrinomonadaceae bacterium]
DDGTLPAIALKSQPDKPALSVEKRGHISVESGRPLAEALKILEARYGLLITYEDPRYMHASEIEDVTEKVRRDLDKFPPGKAPRVLVPKGGVLSFDYDEALTARSDNQLILVQQLVEANRAQGNPGRFRVEQQGAFIHVIPIATRNERGKVVAQSTVFDAVITVPKAKRSGMQTLDAICAAVSQVTGTRVGVGSAPLNAFFRYRDEEGITRRPAREALAELLARIGYATPPSWRLLYDPMMKIYALNVRVVRTAHE